jgi:hypothetical protein
MTDVIKRWTKLYEVPLNGRIVTNSTEQEKIECVQRATPNIEQISYTETDIAANRLKNSKFFHPIFKK